MLADAAVPVGWPQVTRTRSSRPGRGTRARAALGSWVCTPVMGRAQHILVDLSQLGCACDACRLRRMRVPRRRARRWTTRSARTCRDVRACATASSRFGRWRRASMPGPGGPSQSDVAVVHLATGLEPCQHLAGNASPPPDPLSMTTWSRRRRAAWPGRSGSGAPAGLALAMGDTTVQRGASASRAARAFPNRAHARPSCAVAWMNADPSRGATSWAALDRSAATLYLTLRQRVPRPRLQAPCGELGMVSLAWPGTRPL